MRFSPLLFVAIVVACAPTREPVLPPAAKWVSPLGRDHPLVGRVWNVQQRAFVTDDDLVAAIGRANVAGIGEQHDNPDHHLLQARMLDALASRGRSPAVVFEMLDGDDQDAVRRALAQHPRDADAVAAAVDWAHSGWPAWSLYRPVFVAAVTHDMPLVAAGVDRKAAMKLAMEGATAAPADLVERFALDRPLPVATEQSMRVEMRDAHCGLLPDSMLPGMVFVQRVRDASLADGLLRGGADRGAVLIAGNGHVRKDRGAPWVVASHSHVAVVAIGLLEVRDAWTRPAEYAAGFEVAELPFDFVVFTPRASDEDHCAKIRAKHGGRLGD